MLFGSCMIGPLLGEWASRAIGSGAAVAIGLGSTCGLPILAVLVLVWMVYDAHQHFRGARLLEGGVAFGAGETKLRWEDVRSFRSVADGLVLLRRGRRRFLSRWLGPRLPCEGETMHRVVVLLESKNIFAEEG